MNDTFNHPQMEITPQSIFVEARQWVDKTYGNSYFSARIQVNGETVGYLPFQYGYESAYRYAALKWLIENNYVQPEIRDWYDLSKSVDLYAVIYDAKKTDTKRFGTQN